MTTGFCPVCEKRTNVELVDKKDIIEVRGEKIEVQTAYYSCNECQGEFWSPDLNCDPLEFAYEEYRRRHDMLHPDEIKEIRVNYGLTQREFARLLGWGEVTITRYENGALQDKAHDSTLQLVKDPANMLKMVAMNGNALQDSRRSNIEENIRKRISAEREDTNCRIAFGALQPSIFNGFRRFDINKFYQLVNFLCWNTDGIIKTKLNKMLFYVDFLHYKLYAISISGARYAKLTYGPVPDDYERHLRSLIESDVGVLVREEDFGIYTGELYFSIKEPRLSAFSTNEIETMAKVKNYFKEFSASKIKEFSHEEKGYMQTPDSKLISYEFANDLKI